MKVKISGIDIELEDKDRIVSGITLNINYRDKEITSDITYVEKKDKTNEESKPHETLFKDNYGPID